MKFSTFATVLVGTVAAATGGECGNPKTETHSSSLVTSMAPMASMASSANATVTPTATVASSPSTLAISTGTLIPTIVPYTDYLPTPLQGFSTCTNMSMGTTEDLGALASLILSDIYVATHVFEMPNNKTVTFEYGSQRVDLLFQENTNTSTTALPALTIANQILQVVECCALSGYQYCGGSVHYDLNLLYLLQGALAYFNANATYSGNPAVNPAPVYPPAVIASGLI